MSFVTVAEAKSALGLTGNAADTYLQTLINAVEEYAARFCGIALTQTADITENLDGDWRLLLQPSAFPIVSVKSITDNLTGCVFESADYVVNAYGIERAHNERWLPGSARYAVVYTAGYSTPPAGLKLVIIGLVVRSYRAPGGHLADGSETGTSINELDAMAVLGAYRVGRFA